MADALLLLAGGVATIADSAYASFSQKKKPPDAVDGVAHPTDHAPAAAASDDGEDEDGLPHWASAACLSSTWSESLGRRKVMSVVKALLLLGSTITGILFLVDLADASAYINDSLSEYGEGTLEGRAIVIFATIFAARTLFAILLQAQAAWLLFHAVNTTDAEKELRFSYGFTLLCALDEMLAVGQYSIQMTVLSLLQFNGVDTRTTWASLGLTVLVSLQFLAEVTHTIRHSGSERASSSCLHILATYALLGLALAVDYYSNLSNLLWIASWPNQSVQSSLQKWSDLSSGPAGCFASVILLRIVVAFDHPALSRAMPSWLRCIVRGGNVRLPAAFLGGSTIAGLLADVGLVLGLVFLAALGFGSWNAFQLAWSQACLVPSNLATMGNWIPRDACAAATATSEATSTCPYAPGTSTCPAVHGVSDTAASLDLVAGCIGVVAAVLFIVGRAVQIYRQQHKSAKNEQQEDQQQGINNALP